MAEKNTTLNIVIATVDRATAKIKAINEELDKASKPTRELKKAFGELAEKSGLSNVVERFKGVGEAVKETLFKFLEMGAIVGEATHLILELVEGFEQLGKKAERLGVSVDFLAEMRDAAERTGVPVESLDNALESFTVNLGKARAGTGRMAAFLTKAGGPLLQQLKAAKDNASAFDLLANAMSKLTDPAKRAALAQATLGDATLAPLFAKGAEGLDELRQHYLGLAGSQEEAVAASTETSEAMHDLHAATDHVKASLVSGLAPALTIIIGQLTEWLSGHQDDIKQWASDIGEKLPGAVHAVVEAVTGAVSWVVSFVDKIGGLKTVALALGAVLLGPLISAIASFGIALLATPLAPFLVTIAAIVAAVAVAVKAVKALASAGRAAADWKLKRELVSSYKDENDQGDLSDEEFDARARRSAQYTLDQEHAVEDMADKQQDINDSHAGDLPIDPASKSAMYAPSVSDQARAAVAANNDNIADSFEKAMRAAPAAKSILTVDFTNAPKGMRVTTDPQSTGEVDLSVGHNFGFSL